MIKPSPPLRPPPHVSTPALIPLACSHTLGELFGDPFLCHIQLYNSIIKNTNQNKYLTFHSFIKAGFHTKSQDPWSLRCSPSWPQPLELPVWGSRELWFLACQPLLSLQHSFLLRSVFYLSKVLCKFCFQPPTCLMLYNQTHLLGKEKCWVWGHISGIPVLRRWRQENQVITAQQTLATQQLGGHPRLLENIFQ